MVIADINMEVLPYARGLRKSQCQGSIIEMIVSSHHENCIKMASSEKPPCRRRGERLAIYQLAADYDPPTYTLAG
jgi:hypothetical protein